MTADLADRPVFIVYRAARGLPAGFLPDGWDGRWDHRPEPTPDWVKPAGVPRAVALPTDLVEHRSDGASAQVYEVHPIGGNYDPAEYGLPE